MTGCLPLVASPDEAASGPWVAITPEIMDTPNPPAPTAPPEPLPLAEELPAPGAHVPSSDKPISPHRPVRHVTPTRLVLVFGGGFVCVFLFLRVFAVEPFGVPTGSMAPALIGNHREGPCPRCGCPVRVGFPPAGLSPDAHFATVACPNCGQQFSLADSIDLNGDRLLVDKNVFNLRRPRRWEMAVFHCPDPDPKECGKPYVKRVIGLPSETMLIANGDVFADGQLLRKELAEVRETRVVVCDMAYVPTNGGWSVRWLVEQNDPRLPAASRRPSLLADATVIQGGVLTLDAAPQTSKALTYRHWNLDDRKEEPIRAWNSYDGLPTAFGKLPVVHDFGVECDIEVVSASNDASFTCRLTDGTDAVLARIGVGSNADGVVQVERDGHGLLGSAPGVSLEPGRTHHLEFSFFDRRAILAINGKAVLPSADLPPITERGEVRQPLQLSARGCRLVIRNLKLYRDTYYTQFGTNGTQPPHGHPITLGPDEYYMLGDNSGNSQDSRKWPVPGVPEADFIGKPFLIHQPLRAARVTAGGRERVFQTVDWSRLRWLH